MKKQRGEPLIQLEVEERKLLDRLLNHCSKAYDFAAGHRRLFSKVTDASNPDEIWEWKDSDTITIPKSVLLRNVREARTALQKADKMLEEWQTAIKSL
jgi:hypothetical protein